MTIEILENIYKKTLGEDKLSKLKLEFKKRYPKESIFKVEYEKELLKRSIQTKMVTTQELIDLANKRANELKNYLVESKNINTNRIIIDKVEALESQNDDFVQLPLKIIVK
jgi:hypothetical protein